MCLWIINYQPGQTVYQPIIQLFGFDSLFHEIILVNNKYQWPIVQGLFKVYVQLTSGENRIQLSTPQSELSLLLFYSPLAASNLRLRLVFASFADESADGVEHRCKQFVFLTKLVHCTLDELCYKQMGSSRSSLFDIEKQVHHVLMLRKDFNDKSTDNEIFKQIYRQIYATGLGQDSTSKLVVDSALSPALTFASTFENLIVLNLPEQFSQLPASFDEFHEQLTGNNTDYIFYSIGAYLHELGHLLGLDHGDSQSQTIMSSSKGYIDDGKDFFLVTARLCSIIFDRQCACYKEPTLHGASSYAHGLLTKQSTHWKSLCKSDTHCRFPIQFDRCKCNDTPHQCVCSGQFQFETNHCRRLIERLNQEKSKEHN